MKKKIAIALVTVVILGISALGAWSYFRPVDGSAYDGFVITLRRSGYSVQDITEAYSKKLQTVSPNNQKYLDVDGDMLDIIIGKAETIDSILKDRIALLTSPTGDFAYTPLLFNKGYLVVTSSDKNKELAKTLAQLLGKSLIN